MSSEIRLRLLMRRLGEATRPQLAAASGISLVTVGNIVAKLCRRGELLESGCVASDGGRPVRLYRYNARHALAALFCVKKERSLLDGSLLVMDTKGVVLKQEHARFTQIQARSLDSWLDAASRNIPYGAITVSFPEGEHAPALKKHLQSRYGCRVLRVSPADALAEKQDDTLTVCLRQGEKPTGTLQRCGIPKPCGPLWLLPGAERWESLPYNDRSAVEETVSRLLVTLYCTCNPSNLVAYSDVWSEKLTSRIRYNCASKLQGYPPPSLSLRPLEERFLQASMRTFACDAASMVNAR